MRELTPLAAANCQIDTLVIVGVGLIGGSLAMALKKAGCVKHVIGVGRSEANLKMALELGAIDEVSNDLESAVARADMVCLATPVKTIGSIFSRIQPVLPDHCIVTDVGSVKGGVIKEARDHLGQRIGQFVPGHPIAGKENSGVSAAFAELFVNHKVVVTPLEQNHEDHIDQIVAMWQICGADVVEMPVEEHDRVLSLTSHLPHVLAYATVQQLAKSDDRESCYQMAAGGFYDFTRIASADPEMWRDICLMNREELVAQLNQYLQDLKAITELIQAGDGDALEEIFAASQQARSVLIERRQPVKS